MDTTLTITDETSDLSPVIAKLQKALIFERSDPRGAQRLEPFLLGEIYLSDNKKYYYLKLKDNYFDQDNIKVLESLPNGHLYSLIILKLYLKACKYDGHLKMTESIPYDPSKMNILAQVINHDKDNVEKAIKAGIELGLVTLMESGEMWMTQIQNYIGKSTSEADRIREYRSRFDKSVQMYDKCTPEIEIDIKKEIEIEKEKSDNFDKFWTLYNKKTAKDKCISLWNKIKPELYDTIFQHVKSYIEATPDKQYRKNPDTYLRNKCWNDEIIKPNGQSKHRIGAIKKPYDEPPKPKKIVNGEWQND